MCSSDLLILCSTNITYDCIFVTFGSSFIFFLTFDGIILTLCSINILCDFILPHLVVPLFFFSYLLVPSSHCTIPTSHVTVLLSYSVVLFFFFLTFYGTSLTLYNTNITYDCTFVTFGGSIIFSHI